MTCPDSPNFTPHVRQHNDLKNQFNDSVAWQTERNNSFAKQRATDKKRFTLCQGQHKMEKC